MKNINKIIFVVTVILIIISNFKMEWILPFVNDENIKIFVRVSLSVLSIYFSVKGLIYALFPDSDETQKALKPLLMVAVILLIFAINIKFPLLYYGFYKIDNDLKYLEKAVNVEPKNPLYNRELGLYYFHKHEYEKALFYYKIALKNKDKANNHLLHYDIGCAYFELADRGKRDDCLDKAIEHLLEANKKKPDNHEYSIALGKARFFKSPEENDTINYLDFRIEKSKENAEYYYLRGYAHMYREEWELAKADFEKAIKKKPSSVDDYFAANKILYAKATVKVRLKGTKEWNDYIEAQVGDEVEYVLEYKNQIEDQITLVENVMMLCFFPENVEYVKGSTRLYNANHREGVALSDNIVTKGLNIGDYRYGTNGIIKVEGRVVDDSLENGLNRVRMWGRVGIERGIKQDYADIFVRK